MPAESWFCLATEFGLNLNVKTKPRTSSCQLRFGIEHIFPAESNPLAIMTDRRVIRRSREMDQDLLKALQDLWIAAPRYRGGVFSTPELAKVVEACGPYTDGAARYFGHQFAFLNALRSLGLPASAGGAVSPDDLEDVAAQLIDACTCTHRMRIHYCPLDLADDWPDLAFGEAVVRNFTPEELGVALDAQRLAAHHVTNGMDLHRLSMVKWLIVKETYSIESSPGRRSGLFLDQFLEPDRGVLKPHENGWPRAVEDALFFLLLAPWEQWVSYPQSNIFGFEIPWVYTQDTDLFTSPVMPPNPDRLSIYPNIYLDPEGNEHEADTPEKIHLHFNVAAQLARWDHAYWGKLEQAKSTSLFETPIQHFLVRGFQANGIDEFLAHMTTIEAAVGTEADYGPGNRPYQRLKGAKRVAARLAGLLRTPDAAQQYEELFHLRSVFLHGRAGVEPVSATQRIRARSLARRAAAELADSAITLPLSRETLLDELLETGVPLAGYTAIR